jgi:hypothetical protein
MTTARRGSIRRAVRSTTDEKVSDMELSPSQGLSASLTLDFVASRESLDAAEAATKQLPAAALYYGAVCPVFPCEPRGKRPLGALAPHGVKDATRDPDLIRRWWATCPTANIGLACGVTCCALDVDGLEGWHALTGLTARHGALPATVTSCTGAGGWHLFFAMPAGRTVRNSAGKLASAATSSPRRASTRAGAPTRSRRGWSLGRRRSPVPHLGCSTCSTPRHPRHHAPAPRRASGQSAREVRTPTRARRWRGS